MVRQFFDPDDLRPAVVNWEAVAGDLIRHLHAEVAALPAGGPAQALIDEVLAYPGVPARWRQRDLGLAPTPLLTTVFRVPGGELRFFSTITTFATPGDVTLDETRIESVFPVDEATAAYCRALALAETTAGDPSAYLPA